MSQVIMGDTSTRREAQARADRITAFREELAVLVREGVLRLTPDQQQTIDEHLKRTLDTLGHHFDLDLTSSQRQLSRGMQVVSALGGLAFCAALFFFIYRVWGSLTAPLQIAVATAVPLAAVAATEFAARREKTLYFASLLSLVAFAAFVVDLNAIALIFNVTPSPGGFLAWGLFGLALAYHFNLRLPLIAGLGCLVIFLSAALAGWGGVLWMAFLERPETMLPGSALLLGAPLIVPHRTRELFPEVYRLLGLLFLFFALLLLSSISGSSFLPFAHRPVEYFYQLVGLLLCGIAIWFGIRRGQNGVVNLACVFFVISLYVRLTKWWWSWMPKYLFFLLLGLIAVGLLVAFRRLRLRAQEAA